MKDLEIYMHYYITQLGLKHSFHTYQLGEKGWGKPDIVINNLCIKYLWKDIRIEERHNFNHKEWAEKFDL